MVHLLVMFIQINNSSYVLIPDNAENDLECTSEGNVEEKGQGEACIVSTPAFYKIEVKLEQGVKKGTYTLTKIDNVSNNWRRCWWMG